jgi:hypothetical protein
METSLTNDEIQRATNILVRAVQHKDYDDELQAIRKRGQVDQTSSIASLSPFVDEQGIMRVSGRLDTADYLS